MNAASDAPATGSGRSRRHRRVTRVSEVDQYLIDEGLPPSWEDRVGPQDLSVDDEDGRSDRGDGANDARLLSNVPPHSQPRI